MTAAVVVGYGSIGRRHVRLLEQLGCEVSVVSRRSVGHAPRYGSIAEALGALRADYVVVANETSEHGSAVGELGKAGFTGRLLIEKPLGDGFSVPPASAFKLAAVAYNLRFHPMLAALKRELQGERLLTIQVYCGQYLPDWRPDTNYRFGYSADRARGGGVLRDLSHELDYLLWFGGPWRRVAALGGHFSPLEISSDDCWAILLELDLCPIASVQVNYLDRPGCRQVVVNTERHTFCADLVNGALTRDGKKEPFKFGRDETYLAEHRAMLDGDPSALCTLEQGARVMQLIMAVERSAKSRGWVQA
jgi:predicted dehydrogenase